MIKPQLGILIPIVAIVVIRRALWPRGGYGPEDEPAPRGCRRWRWEDRIRGPIRIVTTGAGRPADRDRRLAPVRAELPGPRSPRSSRPPAAIRTCPSTPSTRGRCVIQTTADGREQSIALSRSVGVRLDDPARRPASSGSATVRHLGAGPRSTQTCDPGLYDRARSRPPWSGRRCS